MLETVARSPISATLLTGGDGPPVTVDMQGRTLRAASGGVERVALELDECEATLQLTHATGDARVDARALAAVLEAVFGWRPQMSSVGLIVAAGADDALTRHLLRAGLARRGADALIVDAQCLMQRRGNWLADADVPLYPLDYMLREGRRHPRRPPKPEGIVYARHIPWLDRTLAFRALTLSDVPLFHRWMNDPRVAAFWNEAGSMEAHQTYLATLLADPHMLPLIGCFDETPFGYFEVYWAKENRIAPFCDADDYDRGWHVAVGEDAFRGRRFVSAWLPSLVHYLFLDDPRTNRIVGEPASAHVQQIRNLEVSGFARLKTFDFPHKRAALVMLTRERFFGDRLWLPAVSSESAPTMTTR